MKLTDPKLRERITENAYDYSSPHAVRDQPKPVKMPKPLLNVTEQKYYDRLAQFYKVFKQAITLRMDPPFARYTPDLAYIDSRGALVFVEVKGPHRFREKGIAKAALAAKTYPMLRFELAEWTGHDFKVSILTP